jgi:hypothetical protein
MGNVVTAVTWYKKEDYERALAMFPDRDNLCATYEEWFECVQEHCATLKSQGVTVVPMPLDLDEFAMWCIMNGCAMDGPARASFAALWVSQTCRDQVP